MVHKLVLASPEPAIWRVLVRSDARRSFGDLSATEREARPGAIPGGPIGPQRGLEPALL
jgi:hypothetical protein